MRWFQLLLLLLLVNLPQPDCGRSKPIDYAALEKAWESGDAEEELRTEGDEHYRQLASKNEEEAKALGPQMIFVTMKDDSQEPLPNVASRWKEMLWNGGVEVNVYEVDDAKLLVGLQKGMFVKDVMRFLNDQRDVKEYEWNGKAYPTGSTIVMLEDHAYHKKESSKKRHRKKAQRSKGETKSKSPRSGKPSHKKRKHSRGQSSRPAQYAETTKLSPSDEL